MCRLNLHTDTCMFELLKLKLFSSEIKIIEKMYRYTGKERSNWNYAL